MMTASALPASRRIAASISRASRTATTRAPIGIGSVPGPLTTVTRWPRASASTASREPI